ncbi:tripartite tricarboxylate transporter TctB family protein [Mangrovicella endophytica]|uniref:tripartite tricarboxylate transporter TctB family protein n=1 Tax=Mangrovicella endophytica TaxID=2066697 RepID=UPI000C9E414A|nr:tripartite tricarboxylate transporter TctB family protein [Mangrovicella endophytica]
MTPTEASPARLNEKERRPDRAVLAIAVLLLILSGVVGYAAWSVSARSVAYGLGPTAFPAFVGGALLILSIGTFIAAFRNSFPERDHDEIAPVLWIVGGLLLQLALLRTAGFSIATGLLFAATAKGMGRGPLWLTVPAGIVLSFVIFLIFTRLLQLSLPAGPLERLIP